MTSLWVEGFSVLSLDLITFSWHLVISWIMEFDLEVYCKLEQSFSTKVHNFKLYIRLGAVHELRSWRGGGEGSKIYQDYMRKPYKFRNKRSPLKTQIFVLHNLCTFP